MIVAILILLLLLIGFLAGRTKSWTPNKIEVGSKQNEIFDMEVWNDQLFIASKEGLFVIEGNEAVKK